MSRYEANANELWPKFVTYVANIGYDQKNFRDRERLLNQGCTVLIKETERFVWSRLSKGGLQQKLLQKLFQLNEALELVLIRVINF